MNKLKQIKSLNIFKNLKSDYFIRIIFDNLKKRKTLEMLKYNKNIKERINININEYKEYSEKYSSIEIEIKPVNHKYIDFIIIKKKMKHIFIYILIIMKMK